MPFIEIEKSVRDGDWSMLELHSHAHYEIYFLFKGERSFFLSDAFYKLNAPVVAVIPPHVSHKTEGGSFERHNINVSPEYLDPFQKEVLNELSLQILPLSTKASKTFSDLFEEASGIDRTKKDSEYMLRAVFSYCIYLLSKTDEKRLQPQAIAEKAAPFLLKTIDYINEHYREKITLDCLAESCFVSKQTLLYNFKKYMQASPIDFLLAVRLKNAKRLLVSTNASMNEIAEACGFSSANYFGLIFKRKEKLSPLAFRKMQREKS